MRKDILLSVDVEHIVWWNMMISSVEPCGLSEEKRLLCDLGVTEDEVYNYDDLRGETW